MYKKILLVLGFFGLIGAIHYSGVGSYLSLEYIQSQREALYALVQSNYVLMVVGFILVYTVVVGLSLPFATVLTVTGGFLFGAFAGTGAVVVGATTGAIVIFVISRYVFGASLQRTYGERLVRFNREFDENGFSYLLSLRLIPLFPFYMVNIFAGLTKTSLLTFAWTTAVGIVPGSFVYAYAGSRLVYISSLKDIVSKEILLALVLLGALAIVPTIVKKIKRK